MKFAGNPVVPKARRTNINGFQLGVCRNRIRLTSIVKAPFSAINSARVTVNFSLGFFGSVFNGLTYRFASIYSIGCDGFPIGLRFTFELRGKIPSFLIVYISTDLEIELDLFILRRGFVCFRDGVVSWLIVFAWLFPDLWGWLKGLQSPRCIDYLPEMASKWRTYGRGPRVRVDLCYMSDNSTEVCRLFTW